MISRNRMPGISKTAGAVAGYGIKPVIGAGGCRVGIAGCNKISGWIRG